MEENDKETTHFMTQAIDLLKIALQEKSLHNKEIPQVLLNIHKALLDMHELEKERMKREEVKEEITAVEEVKTPEVKGEEEFLQQALNFDEPSLTEFRPNPLYPNVEYEHIKCLVRGCGEKRKKLKIHLRHQHNLTSDEYRKKYRLPPDYPMACPEITRICSKNAKKLWRNGNLSAENFIGLKRNKKKKKEKASEKEYWDFLAE